MNTSILQEELEQLNTQIEQARQRHGVLEGELRSVEAELETFSADRQRFDALRDACNALDKLQELKAAELFWGGVSDPQSIAVNMEQARSRLASFEATISGVLEKQSSLQQQINECLDELDILEDDVRNAYDREERRQEEYVLEREISSVPYRMVIMPWTRDAESEKRFRRYVTIALLLCLFLSTTVTLMKIPALKHPPLVAAPQRLVSLLKKEPPKPAKERKPDLKKKEEATKMAKKEQEPKPVQEQPEQAKAAAARAKAEGSGVLKFKEAFADLMTETPVAKLGTDARLNNEGAQVKGQAVASRSLVSMQASGGSSGGIGGSGVSRNIGNGNADRLGGSGNGTGVAFVRVQSSIAGPGGGPRPLSSGLAPGRTDEEIQIVFDRYKTALYRIYNQELRKNPTLRGKILMRISIETNGEVSMCKVESTDLASPELVEKIVERIKRFNFGPKEGVSKITILYPIDFLPAG